jgi:hypothetical protein
MHLSSPQNENLWGARFMSLDPQKGMLLATDETCARVGTKSAYRGSHFLDAVRAKGGIPRIVATGMWGRDEQETRRGFMNGISRSIGCGAGSRRYSGRGSAATAFAECDGEVSPKPPSKSTSLQTPTASSPHPRTSLTRAFQGRKLAEQARPASATDSLRRLCGWTPTAGTRVALLQDPGPGSRAGNRNPGERAAIRQGCGSPRRLQSWRTPLASVRSRLR